MVLRETWACWRTRDSGKSLIASIWAWCGRYREGAMQGLRGFFDSCPLEFVPHLIVCFPTCSGLIECHHVNNGLRVLLALDSGDATIFEHLIPFWWETLCSVSTILDWCLHKRGAKGRASIYSTVSQRAAKALLQSQQRKKDLP